MEDIKAKIEIFRDGVELPEIQKMKEAVVVNRITDNLKQLCVRQNSHRGDFKIVKLGDMYQLRPLKEDITPEDMKEVAGAVGGEYSHSDDGIGCIECEAKNHLDWKDDSILRVYSPKTMAYAECDAEGKPVKLSEKDSRLENGFRYEAGGYLKLAEGYDLADLRELTATPERLPENDPKKRSDWGGRDQCVHSLSYIARGDIDFEYCRMGANLYSTICCWGTTSRSYREQLQKLTDELKAGKIRIININIHGHVAPLVIAKTKDDEVAVRLFDSSQVFCSKYYSDPDKEHTEYDKRYTKYTRMFRRRSSGAEAHFDQIFLPFKSFAKAGDILKQSADVIPSIQRGGTCGYYCEGFMAAASKYLKEHPDIDPLEVIEYFSSPEFILFEWVTETLNVISNGEVGPLTLKEIPDTDRKIRIAGTDKFCKIRDVVKMTELNKMKHKILLKKAGLSNEDIEKMYTELSSSENGILRPSEDKKEMLLTNETFKDIFRETIYAHLDRLINEGEEIDTNSVQRYLQTPDFIADYLRLSSNEEIDLNVINVIPGELLERKIHFDGEKDGADNALPVNSVFNMQRLEWAWQQIRARREERRDKEIELMIAADNQLELEYFRGDSPELLQLTQKRGKVLDGDEQILIAGLEYSGDEDLLPPEFVNVGPANLAPRVGGRERDNPADHPLIAEQEAAPVTVSTHNSPLFGEVKVEHNAANGINTVIIVPAQKLHINSGLLEEIKVQIPQGQKPQAFIRKLETSIPQYGLKDQTKLTKRSPWLNGVELVCRSSNGRKTYKPDISSSVAIRTMYKYTLNRATSSKSVQRTQGLSKGVPTTIIRR